MITSEIVPFSHPALPVLWEQIADRTEALRRQSKAENTRRAYASDWRQFTAWCMFSGISSLPARPEAVAGYLSHLTMSKTPTGHDYATNTIARRLASISHFHREAGKPDPTQDERVRTIMDGVRRENATRPTRAKAALLTKNLKRGLRAEPAKFADFRNRAMVLVGFAGAFRSSELLGMDVEHLSFDEEGRVQIRLPRSKTNQNGELETVWLLSGGDHCPVKALKRWLEVSGIVTGPLFQHVDRHGNLRGRLSKDMVSYVVKRLAKRVGLDPKAFAAHSLRSGHVTQALLNDVPLATVQQQTRHRNIQTLVSYNRHIEPMKRNSSASLGL